jgi:hypothetical protein
METVVEDDNGAACTARADDGANCDCPVAGRAATDEDDSPLFCLPPVGNESQTGHSNQLSSKGKMLSVRHWPISINWMAASPGKKNIFFL